MDFWASLEHKIRYKKNLSKERLNEIDKELLECAKICKTLDEKMEEIKTAFKKRGFLCGYKPLLPARVSRRCFHFVQAIAFDSRQPSKGFIFYYFFLFAFSCLYACCSASENGFAYSFTLILSIAISCISCSRIYFATVASFNPTVLT